MPFYYHKTKEEFQIGLLSLSKTNPKFLLGFHKDTEDRIWGFSLLFIEFNFNY